MDSLMAGKLDVQKVDKRVLYSADLMDFHLAVVMDQLMVA
jgi:hypothetical protein